jgi:hypothetical protein
MQALAAEFPARLAPENSAALCIKTGENDSDEILTQGFQFGKGCSLLSVAADLRRFGGSGSGIREKFTV